MKNLKNLNKEPVGFSYPEIFDPYFFVVSSAIIFGDRKVCSLGLDCLDMLIKSISLDRLQEYSNKILGLLIRVTNYK